MFNWFLKLLGIDEDRPSASGNSYLDNNASNTSNTNSTASSAVKTAAVKETPAETISTASKEEAKTAPEKTIDSSVKATETIPEPEPEPEPESKSLADEFPNLKANYIKVLEEGGFTTKAAIDKGSDKDLLALKGIGKATVKILRG